MYLTLSVTVPLYLRRSQVQLLVVKASDPYSLLCDPRDIALAPHHETQLNPSENFTNPRYLGVTILGCSTYSM